MFGGVFQAIFHNLIGFDTIIIILAVGNFFVYRKCRSYADLIYRHFNIRDSFSNLNAKQKQAIQKNTTQDTRLTSLQLLEYRDAANQWYAYYTNITSIFPLTGMLGTVFSLLSMAGQIGMESNAAFFEALTSTFWGIVFAIFYKALDASISYKIEDNEKHMEYLFNPEREK